MASCAGIPIFADPCTLGVPPADVDTLSGVIEPAPALRRLVRTVMVPPACLSQLFVAGRRHRPGASWVTRNG